MPPSSLSDAALLAETVRAAGAERRATAELVALLAEVDARRLYLGQGYPSLFAWCTGVLHLSEPAAYSRITAARTARRYPLILGRLAAGDVTLTTVTLLAAHLTDENHETLFEAARHKSKRDVERLVASLVRQPDIASSLRKMPALAVPSPPSIAPESPPAPASHRNAVASDASARLKPQQATAAPDGHRAERATQSAVQPRPVLAPLASDRYLLKVTLSAEAHAKFDRARGLLRHTVPDGDPAAIVERALTALVEQLERSKCAATRRPRAQSDGSAASRHVPASVRRAVWARDEGRCAFVGAGGRCCETGWLEVHHILPFARGGPATVENLQLRCRAHNAYEARQEFGVRADVAGGRSGQARATLSGQSRRPTALASGDAAPPRLSSSP